jgi:hypothetical protein
MANQGWNSIRPRNGALGASPFTPPVASVDPPAQVVAPSSTSQSVAAGGSPSAKTFGAFTDADGLIASYQSVIEQVTGTVSATGTGLGPYTYSGAADGEAFVHMLLAKDAEGNTLATAVHGVDIASPSTGAQWTVGAVDIDFTTADTLSGINSGTLAVTTGSGATALCSIVVDPDSSAVHTVGVTNGTGVVLIGPNATGRVTAAIDLDALLSVSAEDLLGKVYCVQMACADIVDTASGSSIRWAVGSQTDVATSVSDGLRLARTTASTATWQTMTNGVATAWGSAVTTPTQTVVTLYIVGGSIVCGRFDDGTSTLPAPGLTDMAAGTARRVAVNAAAAGTGTRYTGSALYAMASPGGVAEVVITRLRVSVYG